jgi:hypothetical protein
LAHAHHFLERLDRVTREQTEFALGLYRDPDAVRFVLDRVRLPPDADRVALALDDPREGPFVLVTRAGRFVTCLGRGMHQDHPTVPRDQLDALLAKVAEKRALRELAQRELRPDEEEEDLFTRIVSRGSRLAREDFLALSAFEAMFGTTPFTLMLELAVDGLKLREPMVHGAHRVTRIKSPTAKALEQQDRLTWAVAHLMMLSGSGERQDLDEVLTLSPNRSPTFSCAAQQGLTFFLRGAWAAARFGKAAIPLYRRVLGEARDWITSFDSIFGLAAIGFRHSGSTGEVKRILQAQAARDGTEPEGSPNHARGAVIGAILKTLEMSDEHIEVTRKVGADVCVALGQALPEGHPLRFAAPEDVPPDLARTAVLSFDASLNDDQALNVALYALPAAARASAEDFYYPRDVVRAWLGEWTPQETLDRLKRIAEIEPKKVPQRVESRPGRNDPCPCGSGKKWKKCHGGQQGPGAPASGSGA